MPFYVEYTVPILVEIDLDEEAVVGVYVDDEHVEGPTDVVAVEAHPLSEIESNRAVKIAEQGSWPAWEFGL
ncbi:MAG: hypothetical protein ACT4PW_02020 [Acidimicrobiia bacterium]